MLLMLVGDKEEESLDTFHISRHTVDSMALPSPFAFLDWDESAMSLTVSPAADGKRWGLISIDGASAEDIIKIAKKESASLGGNSSWLHNFATMFPNYCLMAAPSQADSFVITGEANVELEDLETHEIESYTFPASEEAYEAAVQSWKHDSDSDEALAAAEKSAAQSRSHAKKAALDNNDDNDDDYEDVATDDEEDDDDDEGDTAAAEKKHHLESIAQMLDAVNSTAATALRLTPKMMRSAWKAAGGLLPTEDEEMAFLSQPQNHATASFIHDMIGGQEGRMGGQQECHQQ